MYLTLQECKAMRKGPSKKLGCAGDAQGRTGALKEDILVSPSRACRNSDVSLQAVDGGGDQFA